ncbi:MAG: class II aldolase/adducin family protein [Oligoflexia bacterium]|nr:class II aldolase/adducin family protein [Oligoflexia bacterium]
MKQNRFAEIVKYCHLLDSKGFVANHDGNITICSGEGSLWATPTAIAKREMQESMIITLDTEGKKLSGPGAGKAFSEVKLHLSAYRARRDAKACIHAHPPHAMAFALAFAGSGMEIFIPEAIISIGHIIPIVPLALAASEEQMSGVATALSSSDVVLLAGNGVLSIGEDLEQAYLRLELVEHMAKVNYLMQVSDRVPTRLSSQQLETLLQKRRELGFASSGIVSDRGTASGDDVVKQVVENELRKLFGK